MTRAEEVQRERRRKPGSTVLPGIKLGVDMSKLDPAYEHRFVNDTGSRVQQMYENDWDPVSEDVKPDADGEGSVQTKVVGTDSGKPIKAVLMRKRREWYDADQKEKRKVLDEIDTDIKRGTAHKKEGELSGVSYTPDSVVNSVSIR